MVRLIHNGMCIILDPYGNQGKNKEQPTPTPSPPPPLPPPHPPIQLQSIFYYMDMNHH